MRDYSKEQFISRFKNANISRTEAERKYKLKVEEDEETQRRIFEAMNSRAVQDALQTGGGAASGSSSGTTSIPSNCIEFVNNTTDGTGSTFWINTSAPTNYTITWGDGETTTGEVDGVNQVEINHSYPDSDTEYTVRLCFDDISVVTYLEFNGDD